MAYTKWLVGTVGLVAVASLAACGTDVIDNSSGGAGSTGVTSTNTTATTGQTTNVSSSSTGGGGSCSASDECGPGSFCDFPDGFCPDEGTLGQCMVTPNGCNDDCPGFCGCDGQFYCNECGAQQMGIDGPGTQCATPAEYRAVYRPGGLDRVIIRVFHQTDQSCATYRLVNTGGSPPGPQPILDVSPPWELEAIRLRAGSDYDSCIVQNGPPNGMPVEPIDITGNIVVTHEGQLFEPPCYLNLDTTATFAVGDPYIHKALLQIEDGFCLVD